MATSYYKVADLGEAGTGQVYIRRAADLLALKKWVASNVGGAVNLMLRKEGGRDVVRLIGSRESLDTLTDVWDVAPGKATLGSSIFEDLNAARPIPVGVKKEDILLTASPVGEGGYPSWYAGQRQEENRVEHFFPLREIPPHLVHAGPATSPRTSSGDVSPKGKGKEVDASALAPVVEIPHLDEEDEDFDLDGGIKKRYENLGLSDPGMPRVDMATWVRDQSTLLEPEEGGADPTEETRLEAFQAPADFCSPKLTPEFAAQALSRASSSVGSAMEFAQGVHGKKTATQLRALGDKTRNHDIALSRLQAQMDVLLNEQAGFGALLASINSRIDALVSGPPAGIHVPTQPIRPPPAAPSIHTPVVAPVPPVQAGSSAPKRRAKIR